MSQDEAIMHEHLRYATRSKGDKTMVTIPDYFTCHKQTPFFKSDSVPAALLSWHNTRAGVYARLSVMRGGICFTGFRGETQEIEREVIVAAGQFLVAPPQYWHKIALLTDDTCFNLDFFSDPKLHDTAE